VLRQVKGVRLIVTPKDLMGPESSPSPAVEIGNDLIAVDKDIKNGVVSEEELLNAVISHGAYKIAK
jgi:hypothetical protein